MNRINPVRSAARAVFSSSILLPVLAILPMLLSCEAGRHGRILGQDEGDIVGNTKAGAAVYDRLVEDSVTKFFNRYKTEFGRQAKNVAFMRFDNRGAEEVGSWGDQIYELIDTKVNQFEGTRTVSERWVGAGMQEAGIGRAEQLFVPAKLRAFMAAMEKQNQPVDALLFATLTSGRTEGTGRYAQDNYLLTMELIDTDSGRSIKESSKIRVERR